MFDPFLKACSIIIAAVIDNIKIVVNRLGEIMAGPISAGKTINLPGTWVVLFNEI